MRPLELRHEAGGPRLYLHVEGGPLDGSPLHAGVGLELQLAPNAWIGGRYEYTISARGVLRPTFHFAYVCGHAGDCGCELVLALPLNASLRFPERRR